MATDVIDTYIKSPAPPKEPDSIYTYNEQQFSAIEKIIKKQSDAITETNKNASAFYENYVNIVTTNNSVLINTVQTLDAKVTLNYQTTEAKIQNIQTAYADADSALAQRITTLDSNLTSLDLSVNAAIKAEQIARVTRDEALAATINSLQAQIKAGDKTMKSMIAEEASVRSTKDESEAIKRTALSSYVGYADGKTYSASISEMLGTKVGPDGASFNWAVQGKVGTGADGAAGIRLTGVQKFNADGTTTAYSKLIVDANTEINGNLVVSGTITGAKIATGTSGNGVDNTNINNFAVSHTAIGQTANVQNAWASAYITLRKDARVSIIAVYAGDDDQGIDGRDGVLRVLVNNQNFTNNTQAIKHTMSAIAGASTIVSGQQVLTGFVVTYRSLPVTYLGTYVAPSSGDYTFTADTATSSSPGVFKLGMTILVMELSK